MFSVLFHAGLKSMHLSQIPIKERKIIPFYSVAPGQKKGPKVFWGAVTFSSANEKPYIDLTTKI